jgi:predicted AlkP superfamily pyrophosphatase or phosphodiesterase
MGRLRVNRSSQEVIIRFVLAAILLSGCAAAQSRPSVILVSIDGFRWDYLDRGLTPTLMTLARDGVRAKALVPVFPTKTFPNHYAIVTGRYPARNGILGNEFTAPDVGARFSLADRRAVRDARFWLAEPIWVTAERQGQRTAPFFWPGSEAAIEGVHPTYVVPYDRDLPDTDRVRRVLGWLDLPPKRRPTFLTMYLSGVDAAGHRYGPDAPETRAAIAHADSVVGRLVAGLARRRLAGVVDLIVVSDHGMAATSPDRLVPLGEYLPRDWVEVDNLSPVLMAWPRAGLNDSVYARLRRAPHLTVYRKAELPARFRLRGSPRVPPVLAMADPGWTIRWEREGPAAWTTYGDHGYDDSLPDMGAIFLARGPAFRRGVAVPAFRNIHLYSLLAKLLRLQPVPTDGSLDSVRSLLRSP